MVPPDMGPPLGSPQGGQIQENLQTRMVSIPYWDHDMIWYIKSLLGSDRVYGPTLLGLQLML